VITITESDCHKTFFFKRFSYSTSVNFLSDKSCHGREKSKQDTAAATAATTTTTITTTTHQEQQQNTREIKSH